MDYTDSLRGINEQSYKPIINQGYQNLGQKLEDPGTGREDLTNTFIDTLATSFVDRLMAQNGGKLPTPDVVHQYVAANATPANAAKFIQGTLNPAQMNALADQHLQSMPELTQGAQGGAQSVVQGLQGYADQQYRQGADLLKGDVDDAYLQQKRGLIEDLAAQNRLGQANSRYSLDALEANKNKEMQRGLGQLAGQRAQTGTSLGLSGAQMGQQAQQFGQTLGLQNRAIAGQDDERSFNRGLQFRQLDVARQLGEAQAGAGADNGISGGLSGALSGGMLGGKIGGPWGAGIGAGLGGLAGYFGTRRK